MKITRQFDIKFGVHTLELLDDGKLAVIDVRNNYRIYDLDEYQLIDGFKSKFAENVLYINNMAISTDGKYLSFYSKTGKEVALFENGKRRFTHSINAHPSGVETVEFSQDNRYIITGGMEGRLYMWSVATGKKVDTLSHHSDSISAITSNDNGRWIATAGYDKVIKVFNRSFRKNHYKLISHQEPVTTLSFLSQQRLLSTDKEGTILVWDVVKSSVIARLPKFDGHITAVCIDKDEKFMYVAGLGGLVALYDLQERELLKMDFLKQLAGITHMRLCDERQLLIFGLSNGHIPIYELGLQEEQFVAFMKKKDFNSCYGMTEADPKLLYSEAYATLEALFDKSYNYAKDLLRSQKSHEAKELLKYFTASSAKRLIIQKLFNDFALFSTFSEAVRGKKYMMAYSLAEEYTTLKETPEFEKMEGEWAKILMVVRRIINDKASEEKIKQLFKPFMGIPGKNLIIKSLYTNRNVFILFRKHLKEKDYFNAFKLVGGNPFLEDFEEFAKLEQIGEIMKQNTQEMFNEGVYYDAVKLCDVLSYFPKHKAFALALKTRANIYAETMQYFAEKKFSAVYNMIEEHPFLEEAKIAEEIEEGFARYYEKAENFAATGNVASVQKVMEKFAKIKSKVPSIVHLIKVAYWAQLEQGAKAKVNDTALKNGFKEYQKIFGYESMLEDVLKSIQAHRPLKVDFDVSNTKKYHGGVMTLPEKIIKD